jgi:signal transduction histidine kinase
MEWFGEEPGTGAVGDGALILRLREANRNLLHAALSARDSLSDAESSLSNQDRFFAVLAHELRSPLAPIKLVALALDELPASSACLPQLRQTLTRQLDHLVQLINGLDDLTRIKNGKLVLDMQALRPADAMATALEMARPLTEARQQKLNYWPPREPLLILGDRCRLVQVFFNLLSNAVKFTPLRGTITVMVKRKGDCASISIKDSGSGIAPAFLPFVFDMFAQDGTPGAFPRWLGYWPVTGALSGGAAWRHGGD